MSNMLNKDMSERVGESLRNVREELEKLDEKLIGERFMVVQGMFKTIGQ